MTRLEIRGFYFLLGALVLLLWLGRTYRVLAVKDKPANVSDFEQARASA